MDGFDQTTNVKVEYILVLVTDVPFDYLKHK